MSTLGYPMSEETKKKIGNKLSGRVISETTKQKISQAMLNHSVTEETKSRISQKLLGHYVSDLTRQKISMAGRGRHHTEEEKLNMSTILKGRKLNPNYHYHSDETRSKIGTRRGWHHTDLTKLIISKKHVEAMKRGIYNIKPNLSETKFQQLLDSWQPNEWKYVGNGEVFLGNCCPDFININGGKVVIELYGNYWHRNDNPQNRIDYFAKYGFTCLVIWENELKTPNTIRNKVLEIALAAKQSAKEGKTINLGGQIC